MKKRKSLSEIIEIPKMETDNEGLLRGGFAMMTPYASSVFAIENGNCDCNSAQYGCSGNGNCDCNTSCNSNRNCNCDCGTLAPTSTPTSSSSPMLGFMTGGFNNFV